VYYKHAKLLDQEFFSKDELDELHAIAKKNPLSKLISSARWKEESAIDFAFTSAQIEGNTYSKADTIALLKTGRTATDKRFTEALMIVNLRSAYDYILENSRLVLINPLPELKQYHKILMRGILDDSELGMTRKTEGVMIGGCNYVPLSGVAALNKELDFLTNQLNKISDPFEKSIYASSNISYLQYFEDGNKRTSRIFQNAILMANNLAPLLFPISCIRDYLDATIIYYEQGDPLMNRAFFLESYRHAYGNKSENTTP